MNKEESLKLHLVNKGKLEVKSKVELNNKEDLAKAYTPGVSFPCLEIANNESDVYKYTNKENSVCVVTDGSAVLGLGNIGPKASLPVMEGKAILFKKFAGIDAYPICLKTNSIDEIVRTVELISPGFGGINLEDISAPRCFEIEERLKAKLDIPVFHDDQHGTAIAICAGLINALKIAGKEFEEITIVINGAGSAGIATCKLLKEFNVFDIILVDKEGALVKTKKTSNEVHNKMAKVTNKFNKQGKLEDVIKNSDCFIGLSVGNVLTKDMIKTMSKNPIIFAMANPTPEIYPDEANEAGALIVATGRSDFPNQINNVLVFPGIFKGALKARAKEITTEMMVSASHVIASLVTEEKLSEKIIIPSVFNDKVCDAIANKIIEIVDKKSLL